MKHSKDSNIILLGFMGSGKTSLGKLLSMQLNFKFLDLDSEIEKNNGLSINEIFNYFGEIYFRELEKNEIKKLINFSESVISLGGGTFCSQENIDILKKIGLTVYLKASFSTLSGRYSAEEINKRPLLRETEKVENLLKKREVYYSQAELIIETDNLNLTEINEKIVKRFTV